MRRAAFFLVLLPLLGCRGSSATDVRQYRAWCWTRSKPLGGWTTDRARAQAQVTAHARPYPHHNATVKVFTGPLQPGAR